MRKTTIATCSAIATLATLMAAQPAAAQNIMGNQKLSISVDASLGSGTSRFPLSEMTDGNVSDASPFNGYQANNRATGTITITLDQPYDLTAFYLWNDINVRAEGVERFSLRFFDAAGNVIGSDISNQVTAAGQVAPKIVNFSKQGVKRVAMTVHSVRATTGIRRVEIREIGFQGRPAAGAAGKQAKAYRCYDLMRHRGGETNRTFTMVDQFGQTRTLVGNPVELCNPVALNPRDRVRPADMAKRYRDHLVCYEIFDTGRRAARQHNVEVTNQLGTGYLGTGHADKVCLVSTKRHVKAPPPIADSPGPRPRLRN